MVKAPAPEFYVPAPPQVKESQPLLQNYSKTVTVSVLHATGSHRLPSRVQTPGLLQVTMTVNAARATLMLDSCYLSCLALSMTGGQGRGRQEGRDLNVPFCVLFNFRLAQITD